MNYDAVLADMVAVAREAGALTLRHFARFRDLEGRALPDEIVLHVDHEQARSVDALGNRQIGG